MQLTLTRPVTIQAVRHAQRWFPALYRHTDGSLLMYNQFGYDAHFSPLGLWKSTDGGRSWHEEEENVPRSQLVHSFADGTLLELDAYGFYDPHSTSAFCYYGAWSNPALPKTSSGHSAFFHGREDQGEDWLGTKGTVTRKIFRINSPSLAPSPLEELMHGYPHHPWWPLINHLHPPDKPQENVQVGGPHITDTEEMDGRLLAIGYGRHREDFANPATQHLTSVCCYQSLDRGDNWEEIALIARGTLEQLEGFNESTLTALKDGRLYSVLRSGDLLHHSWSSDGGYSWSAPVPIKVPGSDLTPRMVWPRVIRMEDGTLVLAYGRPGKHLLFDPTGTGENWQGHLDLQAWELETQELMGVPANQRLRGDTNVCIRYWDSGDYLSVIPNGPREVLVTYDVQNYVEHWNALPVAAVRMVKVRLGE